jgi:hypothetical protein
MTQLISHLLILISLTFEEEACRLVIAVGFFSLHHKLAVWAC